MSERDIDARRNWKAQVFPYDYYTVEPGEECQYCLTEKQAELLRGIIEPLAWGTRWWSDSEQPIDTEVITAFRDDLIRRLMMSCCGDEAPIQYRWTGDGVLQQSTDGGETWTDAPGFDPRNNSPQYPPVPGEDGDDKKCIAASGMVNLIKSQVAENLTEDMSRYTLGQLITDWVTTYINSSNPFEALLTIATNQIFALVISAVIAALTDPVWDTLQCIFYCRMADDASFNNASWSGVRTDITDQIGGVAGLFLEHLVYLLGIVGLSNVARSQAATEGDCSDCGCGDDACVDGWNVGYWSGGVFVNTGNEDSRGSDYIIAHSIDRGDGQQAIYMSSTGDDVCCDLVIEILTGTGGVSAIIGCGGNHDYTNFVPPGLTPTSNLNSVYIAFSVAGTAKITMATPP